VGEGSNGYKKDIKTGLWKLFKPGYHAKMREEILVPGYLNKQVMRGQISSIGSTDVVYHYDEESRLLMHNASSNTRTKSRGHG
jgi:hypothetical protein